MQVILLERIEKLGQMGEVVNVKPGYARNYLLPKRKALRATKENIAGFESERVQLEGVNLDSRHDAEAVAAKIEGLMCVLLRQASDSAQLYGSVTARDIAEAVIEAGATINRTQVRLDRPIKTLGIHRVRIALHPEVIVDVRFNIARSLDEAQAAAARGETAAAGADETATDETATDDTGTDEAPKAEANADAATAEPDAGPAETSKSAPASDD